MGEVAEATVGSTTVSSSRETADEIRAALTGTESPPTDAVAQPAEPPAEVGEQPPAEPAPDSEAGKTLAKKKRSLQDRIDEITHEKYATARERDAAVAERDALKAELAHLKSPKAKAPAPAAGDDAPKLDDFQTYEDYVDARARYVAKQEWEARESDWRERNYRARQDQEIAQLRQQGSTRMRDAIAADPDLPSKINPELVEWKPLSALPDGTGDFRNAIAEVIFRSPVPDKWLVALSEDPSIIQRLSTLYPDAFNREMGKLELRIEGAPSGPPASPPAITRAKPPIKPVDSSPSAVDDDLDSLPLAELAKRRRMEERSGGRSR